MNMQISQDTLMKFCAEESEYREVLREPIYQNGYVYFTDGKIAVCIKNCSSRKNTNNGPDMDRLFDDRFDSKEWAPFPKHSAGYVLKKCLKCCSGYIPKECPDCSGEGFVVCLECENETECKKCGGEGYISDEKILCNFCNGTGSVKELIPQKMPGTNINVAGRMFQLVHSLPNPEYSIHSPKYGVSPMVLLRFDGGTGIVMPLRT